MKGVFFKLYILLLVSGITVQARSQGIVVKATLDTNTILIGDQIHYTIEIEQPKGVVIAMPLIKDSLAGKIEVLEISAIDSSKAGNDQVRIKQSYLITSFDSGSYTIPSLPFAFKNGSISDTIYSMPQVLNVNTIALKNQKEFYDIKDILKIPLTFKEILFWALILLGVWLIVTIIILVIRRKKNNQPIFGYIKPQEPAHVIAFRSLEALKNEKLWQQGHTKQYHSKLTDIIRLYIEQRYHIPAMESTTDEILDDVKKLNKLNEKSIINLRDILVLADLVKFAKAEPLPDENENSWGFAYQFVKDTYEVAEAPAEEANKENQES